MTATISMEEVKEAHAAGRNVALVDCRTGAEFESAHIPGSFNVPLDRLDEFAERLSALDVEVVSVCQTGVRAQQGMQKLQRAGTGSVRVLDGGVAAWEKAGGPLERGNERWAMDRQVRGVAGSLVLAGLVVGRKFPKARALSTVVGAGLLYSALSNTCYMAQGLAMLPYNRTDRDPADDVEALERANGSQSDRAAAA